MVTRSVSCCKDDLIGQNRNIIYGSAAIAKDHLYLNISTGSLYGSKADSGWGTGVLLAGPARASGANITNRVARVILAVRKYTIYKIKE